MRILILLLISCSAFGQSYIPFATGRTTDTGKTTGSVLIPYVLRLPNYASSDSNKVLGITSNGTLVLRTKTAAVDTPTFQEVTTAGATSTNTVNFGVNSKFQIDSNNLRHYSSGVLDLNVVQNTLRMYNGGSSFYNQVATTQPTSNRLTYFPDTSGVVVLNVNLRDSMNYIRNNFAGTVTSITPGYGHTSSTPITTSGTITVDSTKFASVFANSQRIPYSDTSVNVITRTYANTNLWKVAGNSLGTTMIGGTIDSNHLKHIVYNITVDSVSRVARTGYFINSNSESSRIFTNLTTAGAVQTNGVLIGIGRGSQYSSNIPFIQLGGTTASSSQTSITQEGFNFSAININPPNATTTPTTIIGGGRSLNAVNSFNFTFGTYSGNGAITATSGTLSLLGLGLFSGTNATFAPVTGSCKRFVLSDVGSINQTGSASAITGTLTNQDITLTSATDYRFCYATNNSGTAYSSVGTAKSTLLGNLIIGSTTDNGNPLQITNGSIYASTMSAGAASDSLIVLDNTTKVYKKYLPINKILKAYTPTLVSGTVTVLDASVGANTAFSYSYKSESGVQLGHAVKIVGSAGVGFTVTALTITGTIETQDNSTLSITVFYNN